MTEPLHDLGLARAIHRLGLLRQYQAAAGGAWALLAELGGVEVLVTGMMNPAGTTPSAGMSRPVKFPKAWPAVACCWPVEQGKRGPGLPGHKISCCIARWRTSIRKARDLRLSTALAESDRAAGAGHQTVNFAPYYSGVRYLIRPLRFMSRSIG